MTRLNSNLYVDDKLADAQVIWASGTADPHGLSVGISKILYDFDEAVLRCIGAAAVNQAIKGVAIARGYVAQKGYDLVVRPGFINVPAPPSVDAETVSAIMLRITLE